MATTTADWLRLRLAAECGPRIIIVPTYRGNVTIRLADGDVYQDTFWAGDGTPIHMTIHVSKLAELYGSYLPPGILTSGGRIPQQAFDALLARCDEKRPRYLTDERGNRVKSTDGADVIESYDDNAAMSKYWQKWRKLGYI